jgi:Raf kinase inhibitor-like YbhB/YbcL family protein
MSSGVWPRSLWLVVLGGVAAAALGGCLRKAVVEDTPPTDVVEEGEATAGWWLTSPAFGDGERIPQQHTGDGDDVSPELTWSDPPEGTVEMVLICSDPDAPGANWIHWVLYGLPADRRSLPEALPDSPILARLGGVRQGRTSWGDVGYRGPAPPKGPAHHYHFRLCALDARTDLPPQATEATVREAMAGHILGYAELVGLYSR